MGQYREDGDAVVQRIRMAGGGFGAIAYWDGHVFFACDNDFLRDYAMKNGQMILNTYSRVRFLNPGATPTISANGKENGITWAVATRVWDGADRPAVLYAFNAKNLEEPIYNSEQNSARDRAGLATRFVVPVVSNGRVYVAARGEVDVYGLLH
jgi:outer membrane protein assembly factor BamB